MRLCGVWREYGFTRGRPTNSVEGLRQRRLEVRFIVSYDIPNEGVACTVNYAKVAEI